jgi:hypothetical protein
LNLDGKLRRRENKEAGSLGGGYPIRLVGNEAGSLKSWKAGSIGGWELRRLGG